MTCRQRVRDLPHLAPPQHPVRLHSVHLPRCWHPANIEGAGIQEAAGHGGRVEALGLGECALGVHAELALREAVDAAQSLCTLRR